MVKQTQAFSLCKKVVGFGETRKKEERKTA
jgi:hypothetical protein